MSSIKSSPREAQIMAAILKDMGVADYEPRVINQMLEFTYRYVTDILDDAKVYSSHANKKNVDSEDVRMAIQCKLDHSFTTPPPKDLLMDIARHKNNTPLPLIKPYAGIRLPPDRYCLSQANYRMKPYKKPNLVQVQGSSLLTSIPSRMTIHTSGPPGLIKSTSGTSALGPSLGATSLTLVSRGVTQPTVTMRPSGITTPVTMRPSTGTTPVPIIRLNPGGGTGTPGGATMVKIESVKRKREDDDDYDNP